MDLTHMWAPLFGGSLIGIAVTMMLLFNGRVTGISGIIASSYKAQPARVLEMDFLSGLLVGGLFIQIIRPELLVNTSERSSVAIMLAGLLVGYGTVMGSGCTSGHGVCGMSRLSVRSIMATFTFMLFGFLTVLAIRYLAGDTV